jgi:hypothetical protein
MLLSEHAEVLNDTGYPDDYNYFEPSLPVIVNGRADPTSQRMHDVCTPFNISISGQPVWNISISAQPPFDLRNVAISPFSSRASATAPLTRVCAVSNGICASTCAQFSTVMHERHHVKMATFGGKPGEPMEYKGMAGLESLEFADLKSEIKTARLNNSTLAPPDLLVNGNMRYETRRLPLSISLMSLTAVSTGGPHGASLMRAAPLPLCLSVPTVSEAMISIIVMNLMERPDRFPYTDKTYSDPQALWTFA